eukprot:SAG31_NODE_198_length_20656_cov_5.167291_15_plen_215_part_00
MHYCTMTDFRVGRRASTVNDSLALYKSCGMKDLQEDIESSELPECTHPPYLDDLHHQRQKLNAYQANTFSICYQCYCSVKTEKERVLGDYSDDDYCSPYKKFSSKNQYVTLIATVAVVIINVILKQILKNIVGFEKAHNLSEKNSSIAGKVFLAQVFNTAILVLILNADLESVRFRSCTASQCHILSFFLAIWKYRSTILTERCIYCASRTCYS